MVAAMKTSHTSQIIHPAGEAPRLPSGPLPVDTYGGRIHVEWDPQAAVTPLGQLPFFIEFLKTAELFAPWVRECPLTYRSPNAPQTIDVLGTLFLSILSGHRRYAHITTIRTDGVNPALLGMSKVCSEDAVRRALGTLKETASTQWLQTHLLRCYEPLLTEPWILDVDVTVKPLYGHQEGAEVGYNPHKPGRPSHTYHTYFIGNLRLALECESPARETDRGGSHAPRPVAVPASLPPFRTTGLSAGRLCVWHRSPDARSRSRGLAVSVQTQTDYASEGVD
jgi:hypothetical protein